MSLSSLSPVSGLVSPADRVGAAFTPTSTSSLSPTRRPPLRTTTATDIPDELFDLKRRTHALQAERDHFQQLGQRAADAFEEHRRDVTQLMQKERAVRAHREDALREQLQETLKANRELMARVVEQRRQCGDAWRAELQGHRADNAHRQAELEALLTQLHTKRDELQRSVMDAERTHDACRRDIEACVEEQKQLRAKLNLLRDGLRDVAEKEVKNDEQIFRATDTHRNVEHDPWRTGRSQRTRQPCCEYCDVPPTVWTGPSPTRRVPRRRFVPAGPWDACSPCRASSPTTHHVDALVSSIERGNYLRPRRYLRRCRREASPLVVSPGPRDWQSDDDDSSVKKSEDSASTRRVMPRLPRVASVSRPHQRSGSPGLSSATTATTSAPASSSSSSSSFASSSTPAPIHRQTAEERLHHGARRSYLREAGPVSCTCLHDPPSSFSSPLRRAGLEKQRDAHLLNDGQPSSLATHISPSAKGLQQYDGSAINAACHSLISSLADVRAEYLQYQRQLRDPRGDSVEASREMRRLMRQMDITMNQLRALRKEQERCRGPLRVHDVLQEVVAENRYCEAVYRDLIELIRA
jgi:hypothetical protein